MLIQRIIHTVFIVAISSGVAAHVGSKFEGKVSVLQV